MSEYFRGIIVSKLTNIISDKLLHDDVSVISISSYVDELSTYSEQVLNVHFEKYGITLKNFTIMSISVKEDDKSFIRLKEAKDLAAKISVVGERHYRMERSFNVLDKAAEHGGMMGSSLELGAGVAIGSQVGNLAAEHFSVNSQNIPPIPQKQYYLAIQGQQQGPYNSEQIGGLIRNKVITSITAITTFAL
jgi:membrane protease subunit (stomatin/prohibitin family)